MAAESIVKNGLDRSSTDNATIENANINDTRDSVSAADLESKPVDDSPDPLLKKQSWKEIALLSFSSLGAIYGDLGTSPLYVLNSIKYSETPPNQEDIYGAISIIFYIFTIIVIFKYVLIVLYLGPNNGEGGQVAIYAKIARYLHIGPKGVHIPGSPEISDLDLLSRQDTTSSFRSSSSKKSIALSIRNNTTVIKCVSKFILFACFLGCSLVVSDGLLTPTTSVLSAIGGIQIAKPDFSNVLAVSEVILICLFVIQKFGSNRISFLFAPIIFLWMIGLIGCGLYNIIQFHPGIFKALSPYYAIQLLRSGGIDVFSGAMLSITGTEAMFADIGHFGRLPIQLTLTTFVYPSLMICYLGQAAYLVHHPDAYVNPFFLSLPGGSNSPVFWIMFVLATLATIIASQALILSVFSIVSQLINLDCFPNLKIVHTSKNYVGKVYIPLVNWILMVGVCATTAGFQNSNAVTAAYGLGISVDFLVTTCLIFLCMFYVYDFNLIYGIVFVLIFIPLEVCLVVANLKKVVHGAWFTIMVTVIVFTFLSLWRWGRSRKINQEIKARIKIGDIYPLFGKSRPVAVELNLNRNVTFEQDAEEEEEEEVDINDHDDAASVDSENSDDEDDHDILHEKLVVKSRFGNTKVTRGEGIAMMYNDTAQFNLNSPNTLPHIYGQIVKQFSSIPSVFVFVSFRVLSIPVVPAEDRALLGTTKIPGHYKCILRFGFTEDIRIDKELNNHILASIPEIENLSRRYNGGRYDSDTGFDNIPIVHIFESNLIRCHDYSNEEFYTKNPFKKAVRFVEKLLINDFFSPLHAVTQENGAFVKLEHEVEESEKKLFIGGIVRI